MIDKPILRGWDDEDPVKKELTKALAEISPEKLADISEIKPEPSSSYPDKIMIYTRSFFEVVTTVGYLPEKVNYLDDIITGLQEEDITSGRLTLLEADTHIPFELEETIEKRDF
jgi:cell division protein FtsQ